MLFVLGWVLLGVWAVLVGIPSLWFVSRSLRGVTQKLVPLGSWPRVSVIVPARDESHKIEAALRSLLAQDYPNFEVIAIDDRSRDETGAIMDRLATETAQSPADGAETRFRVLHVEHLPENWLGKNHALQLGCTQSQGELILFTDGDVLHAPDVLRRSVTYVESRQLDHLPLYPDVEAHTAIEAGFVTAFAILFLAGTQPPLVSSRLPWFYAGVGAFNLVRRSALDRAGGFLPIRLDVLDDVKLGKLLKRTGGRSETLRAGTLLSIRWQQSAWACITGLEKNAFAAAGYSLPRMLFMLTVIAAVYLGPLIGTLAAGPDRTGFVAALVLSHILYAFNAWLFGHSPWVMPLFIPSGLALIFAFARSTWITLSRGGVRWRETFYPLSLLRQNLYR